MSEEINKEQQLSQEDEKVQQFSEEKTNADTKSSAEDIKARTKGASAIAVSNTQADNGGFASSYKVTRHIVRRDR